jgi:hypothetical protein
MDCNKSGRILLGIHVPESMWPLILEQANGLFAEKDAEKE